MRRNFIYFLDFGPEIHCIRGGGFIGSAGLAESLALCGDVSVHD